MTTVKVITEIEIADARHCHGYCPYLDILPVIGDYGMEYSARCQLCEYPLVWDPIKATSGYLRCAECRKLVVAEEG